jgi:hypothetical protein
VRGLRTSALLALSAGSLWSCGAIIGYEDLTAAPAGDDGGTGHDGSGVDAPSPNGDGAGGGDAPSSRDGSSADAHGNDAPPPPADGNVPVDGNLPPVDGGGPPDGNPPPVDANPPIDANPPVDANPPIDANQPFDANPPIDANPPVDANPPLDTNPPFDGNMPPDGGLACDAGVPLFYDDFESTGGNVGANWDSLTQIGGTMTLSAALSTSPTHSALVAIPQLAHPYPLDPLAVDGGGPPPVDSGGTGPGPDGGAITSAQVQLFKSFVAPHVPTARFEADVYVAGGGGVMGPPMEIARVSPDGSSYYLSFMVVPNGGGATLQLVETTFGSPNVVSGLPLVVGTFEHVALLADFGPTPSQASFQVGAATTMVTLNPDGATQGGSTDDVLTVGVMAGGPRNGGIDAYYDNVLFDMPACH